jgi:hypothetical protein
MTLRQMKLLKVAPSSLAIVKMSTIENFETIAHLEWLRRRYPGTSINELILHTPSTQYAETSITQAGSQIASAEVRGGVRRGIGSLMKTYEDMAGPRGTPERALVDARHKALLEKFGLQRNSEVLMQFDINFTVRPASAGGGTPPVRGTQ